MKRRKLGELLVEAGVIDPMQLQAALGHQRRWGMQLGRALVEQRFCTEQQIVDVLSRETGLPAIELELSKLDRNMAEWVPQKLAEQYRLVPLRLEGGRGEALVIALGGAPDLEQLDTVRTVSRKARIVAYLAKSSQVDRALDVLYRGMEPPPDNPEPEPPPVQAQVTGEVEFDLVAEVGTPEERPAASKPGPQASLSPTDLELDALLGRVPPPSPVPAEPAGTDLDALLGIAGDWDHIPTAEELAQLSPKYQAPPAVEPPRRAGATYDEPVSAPAPAPPPAAPQAAAGGPAVLVYGWPAPAASLLASTLAASGIASRIVSAQELAATEADVVVAPLPAIEALAAAGACPQGSIIVAVKSPESDLARAQRVGARGYLATPVDSDLLVRAVRRCMARPESR